MDLESECPFWVSKHMCARNGQSGAPPACSVCKCSEDEVPAPWKIKKEKKEFPFGQRFKRWVDDPKHLWYPPQNEERIFLDY